MSLLTYTSCPNIASDYEATSVGYFPLTWVPGSGWFSDGDFTGNPPVEKRGIAPLWSSTWKIGFRPTAIEIEVTSSETSDGIVGLWIGGTRRQDQTNGVYWLVSRPATSSTGSKVLSFDLTGMIKEDITDIGFYYGDGSGPTQDRPFTITGISFTPCPLTVTPQTPPVWENTLAQYTFGSFTGFPTFVGNCASWDNSGDPYGNGLNYGYLTLNPIGSGWVGFRPNTITISGPGLGAFLAAGDSHEWGYGEIKVIAYNSSSPVYSAVTSFGFTGGVVGVDSYTLSLVWDPHFPSSDITDIIILGGQYTAVSLCNVTFTATDKNLVISDTPGTTLKDIDISSLSTGSYELSTMVDNSSLAWSGNTKIYTTGIYPSITAITNVSCGTSSIVDIFTPTYFYTDFCSGPYWTGTDIETTYSGMYIYVNTALTSLTVFNMEFNVYFTVPTGPVSIIIFSVEKKFLPITVMYPAPISSATITIPALFNKFQSGDTIGIYHNYLGNPLWGVSSVMANTL